VGDEGRETRFSTPLVGRRVSIKQPARGCLTRGQVDHHLQVTRHGVLLTLRCPHPEAIQQVLSRLELGGSPGDLGGDHGLAQEIVDAMVEAPAGVARGLGGRAGVAAVAHEGIDEGVLRGVSASLAVAMRCSGMVLAPVIAMGLEVMDGLLADGFRDKPGAAARPVGRCRAAGGPRETGSRADRAPGAPQAPWRAEAAGAGACRVGSAADAGMALLLRPCESRPQRGEVARVSLRRVPALRWPGRLADSRS
jgi:hypothetical protein